MILPPNLGYELVNPPLDYGSGFQFGRGTKVHVANAQFSSPDVEVQDQPNPFTDGVSLGRDYFRGRTITFDINIRTTSSDTLTAYQLYCHMEQSWFTEDTFVGASRLTPGEVSELVMNRHGEKKIAIGRPRSIEPTTGRVDGGWIPVTANFQMITHKFYSADWSENTIGIVPGTTGGLEFPLEFPLNTVTYSENEDVVEVGGNTETWMLSTIHGPISRPEIEVGGYYKITTDTSFALGPSDYLEIDPRPWSRKILMNGNINVAGRFTQDSRRISMQTLPPGINQVVLRGTDPTGLAYLTTRWRNAFTTW